jgi:hypothetical protein
LQQSKVPSELGIEPHRCRFIVEAIFRSTDEDPSNLREFVTTQLDCFVFYEPVTEAVRNVLELACELGWTSGNNLRGIDEWWSRNSQSSYV